jgi:adenylate cyclase
MFQEALRLDGEFALAYAGLGEAYWQKYQITHDSAWVDAAISASDHALVLDPNQAQVHIALGIIYHGTGKIDSAIEELKRAIELQPAIDDALAGKMLAAEGNVDSAIECFEKAIRLRPGIGKLQQTGHLVIFWPLSDAAEQFRRVITISRQLSRL